MDDTIHVKPVKKNGKTVYQVHKVGKNFSDHVQKGEHLSDTELDDFSEMGGKIKHIKEARLLKAILDEARGRPKTQKMMAPEKGESKAHEAGESEEDESEDKGPEPDKNIHVQLKKASDNKEEKGGADVTFGNGKTHFVKHDVAGKVVSALEKLKPADRAKLHDHIYKSHEHLMSVHKVI